MSSDANTGGDPAAPAAAPAAPAVTEPKTPVASDSPKDWSSVLVIAGGPIPAGEKRPVIVCETRGDDGADVVTTYPKGADVYVGHVGTDFGANSPVLRLGTDLDQSGNWGLSAMPGSVHVGPSHPAYAGLNVATLRKPADMTTPQAVEIKGLSAIWKERLRPWIDAIATAPAPGTSSDVVVSLS